MNLHATPATNETPLLEVRLQVPDLADLRAGNTGIEGVWSFAAPEGGPHLLLTGLVHGNEIAGALMLARWLRDGVRPRRGRLTLCFANLAAFDRFDPADPTASRFVDEDMNRLWAPEQLEGARRSSELDRARRLLPVVREADVLLDLHSMLWPSDPLFIAGPGGARELGRAIGAPPVVVSDEGHAAGLRLIDHARFAAGARALLLEAGPHWQPETLAQMEETAARLLRALDMAGRDAPVAATPPVAPGRVARVTRTVTAQSTDFAFLREFRGGEVIARRNTLIALDGEAEIRTPHDDCLLVMPSPRAMRGHTAVRLARFED
ncbi:M14 family metallopeptidase [Falsiroseomonas oryziterrae]|uniref:succinylglutamate desuccinylase/aspartoacylase domain-containing protein n=1 Tax=Falsiroseomonas oryziterrae TaxID=2911368 RepID=UPI001EFFACBE|nr:succinylglutamate desuccinylase/aspartoacylase family protein [Roseomonas sp. NPKOSM-4]